MIPTFLGLLVVVVVGILFMVLFGARPPHPDPAPPTTVPLGDSGEAGPRGRHRPVSVPTQNAPSAHTAPNGYHLDAQKTIRAFDFILRSLGRTPPWQSPEHMEDYIHDLTVMLQENDLEMASLELLGPDRSVIYRHEVRFGSANGQRGVDAAGGIELPLVPPDRIADHRLLIQRSRQIPHYRHRLRLSWSRADTLPERSGSRFSSEHTRHVNRDRMTGQVFVTDEVRRTATVINVSAAGDYAFARDPALPLDVFLHKAQCEQPLEFRPGMKLSFIPIQVPRGLQGRNIRLA